MSDMSDMVIEPNPTHIPAPTGGRVRRSDVLFSRLRPAPAIPTPQGAAPRRPWRCGERRGSGWRREPRDRVDAERRPQEDATFPMCQHRGGGSPTAQALRE